MPSTPPCNANRLNCLPAEVLAATAIPSCGQFVSPYNLQAEQLVFDQAFNDLINNFGLPVDYYINTFNLSAADLLYGEDFGNETDRKQFQGPLSGMQMYIELSDDAINLSKFGFDPDDEFTAFVHISTFQSTASAYFDYAVLGHYIWRLRGKRYNYSFESGLSSEPVNEQIYDSTFSGLLSTTLYGQSSSAGKQYANEHDPYDIGDVSKAQVMDMDVNDTDIYGSYY